MRPHEQSNTSTNFSWNNDRKPKMHFFEFLLLFVSFSINSVLTSDGEMVLRDFLKNKFNVYIVDKRHRLWCVRCDSGKGRAKSVNAKLHWKQWEFRKLNAAAECVLSYVDFDCPDGTDDNYTVFVLLYSHMGSMVRFIVDRFLFFVHAFSLFAAHVWHLNHLRSMLYQKASRQTGNISKP